MSLFAASVDSEQDTLAVAADLGFPVAWGVTRETGDRLGAFWDERRQHIQPSEFLITRTGRVMSSTYSSSPVGRMDPQETLLFAKILASRSK